MAVHQEGKGLSALVSSVPDVDEDEGRVLLTPDKFTYGAADYTVLVTEYVKRTICECCISLNVVHAKAL